MLPLHQIKLPICVSNIVHLFGYVFCGNKHERAHFPTAPKWAETESERKGSNPTGLGGDIRSANDHFLPVLSAVPNRSAATTTILKAPRRVCFSWANVFVGFRFPLLVPSLRGIRCRYKRHCDITVDIYLATKTKTPQEVELPDHLHHHKTNTLYTTHNTHHTPHTTAYNMGTTCIFQNVIVSYMTASQNLARFPSPFPSPYGSALKQGKKNMPSSTQYQIRCIPC